MGALITEIVVSKLNIRAAEARKERLWGKKTNEAVRG